MIIYDNFLLDPDTAINDAAEAGFNDIEYSDGVTYPDISRGGDEDIRSYVIGGIQQICGFDIDVKEFFYRRSKSKVDKPHWAHSDAMMGDYVAILYLSDPPDGVDAGTVILEHVDGWRRMPETEDQLDQLKTDTNDESKWNIVQFAKMKKNRIIVHPASELHASMPKDGFGDESDGRLVLVVFFDQKKQFIRAATPADAPEMTELYMEFVAEQKFDEVGLSTNPVGWCAEITNAMANNPMFKAFVAIDRGQVVAMIAMSVGSSWVDRRQLIAEERFWYVTPKFRKSRIGLKIFNAAEDWAKAAGASAINFIALSTSPDSVERFYEKRGYKKLETHFMKVL